MRLNVNSINKELVKGNSTEQRHCSSHRCQGSPHRVAMGVHQCHGAVERLLAGIDDWNTTPVHLPLHSMNPLEQAVLACRVLWACVTKGSTKY